MMSLVEAGEYDGTAVPWSDLRGALFGPDLLTGCEVTSARGTATELARGSRGISTRKDRRREAGGNVSALPSPTRDALSVVGSFSRMYSRKWFSTGPARAVEDSLIGDDLGRQSGGAGEQRGYLAGDGPGRGGRRVQATRAGR